MTRGGECGVEEGLACAGPSPPPRRESVRRCREPDQGLDAGRGGRARSRTSRCGWCAATARARARSTPSPVRRAAPGPHSHRLWLRVVPETPQRRAQLGFPLDVVGGEGRHERIEARPRSRPARRRRAVSRADLRLRGHEETSLVREVAVGRSTGDAGPFGRVLDPGVRPSASRSRHASTSARRVRDFCRVRPPVSYGTGIPSRYRNTMKDPTVTDADPLGPR